MRFVLTKISYLAAIIAVAVVAAVILALVPSGQAAADSEHQLLLQSQNARQYGDRIFELNKYEGIIYVRENSGRYMTSLEAETNYYIKASEIMVRVDPEEVEEITDYNADADSLVIPLCDDKGLICAEVLDSYDPAVPVSGRYYFTYSKGGVQTFFKPLTIYDASTHEPSGRILTKCTGNDYLYIQIIPRVIEIGYLAASSETVQGEPIETTVDGAVQYMQHTYGDAAYTVAFGVAEGKKDVMHTFGDELPVEQSFAGNDILSHVGDYEIDAFDLKVWRDNGLGSKVDVSHNYTFVSDRAYTRTDGASTGYGIRVVPRPITIGSSHTEASFSTRTGVADAAFYGAVSYVAQSDVAADYSFSSQAMVRAEDCGVAGQDLVVYYDVLAGQPDLWDVDENDQIRTGVVAITPENVSWQMRIVGWTVANHDTASDYDVSAADYVVQIAQDATVDIEVNARHIYLYDTSAGGEATEEGEWVDVVSNHIAISAPYGRTYGAAPATHKLSIDGILVTLSFEVEYEGKSLQTYFAELDVNNDDDTDNDISAIRLEEGTYAIINPNVNDSHYVVTVHQSVHWQVTKREVSYDMLQQWDMLTDNIVPYVAQASGTVAEKEMATFLAAQGVSYGVCIGEFAYDPDAPDRKVVFSFTDADLDLFVAQDIVLVGAQNPGYYAVSNGDHNYRFADDLLYIRILPVAITLEMPTDAIYDAKRHEPVLQYDGAADNPFAGEWSATLSYRVGKNVSDPVNAGTYTVVVTVQGPAESAANPYLVYRVVNAQFTIQSKAVTVTLDNNARVTKPFGDKINTYNSFTATGLQSSDSVELISDGFVDSAAPGSYPFVVNVTRGVASNYTITLVDSRGVTPTFTVQMVDAATVVSYFARQLTLAAIQVTTDSIRMPAITYSGIAVDGVVYRYAVGGGDWQPVPSSNTLSGLAEGTRYRVCVEIQPSSRFFSTTVAQRTDPREIITEITKPVLSQSILNTSGRAVGVSVDNYDKAKTYAVVVFAPNEEDEEALPEGLAAKAVATTPNDEGIYILARAYKTRYNEDEDTIVLGDLAELAGGTTYRVVVVIKTDDSYTMSEPLTVRTRSAAPTLTAASFTVEDHSIKVPEGYYVYVMEDDGTNTLPVAAMVVVSMQEVGLTYAMLVDNEEEDVTVVLDQLDANKAYVIAIWTLDEDEMPSDVQCFRFRTRIDQSNRFEYTGFMLVVSRYLLVTLLVAVFVSLIVCIIRFAFLKKILSGGNR